MHEDFSFQKMVIARRYYGADFRRSPFHHLQLTAAAVMPPAGHAARPPAGAVDAVATDAGVRSAGGDNGKILLFLRLSFMDGSVQGTVRRLL